MQRHWLLKRKIDDSTEWRVIMTVSKTRSVLALLVAEKVESAYKVEPESSGVINYDKNVSVSAQLGFRVRC